MGKGLLIACILFLMNCTFANSQAENTFLARINAVLTAAYPLIDQAQEAAEINERVSFDYDRLRQDIQAIQLGIAAKVNHTDSDYDCQHSIVKEVS